MHKYLNVVLYIQNLYVTLHKSNITYKYEWIYDSGENRLHLDGYLRKKIMIQ